MNGFLTGLCELLAQFLFDLFAFFSQLLLLGVGDSEGLSDRVALEDARRAAALHALLEGDLLQPISLVGQQNLFDFLLGYFALLPHLLAQGGEGLAPLLTGQITQAREQVAHGVAALFADFLDVVDLIVDQIEFLLDLLPIQQAASAETTETAAISSALGL